MSNDELFELVAVLTAKNMALEGEIKRLEKQTDRLWEDLKEYEKGQDEEFDFDYDAEVLREEIEQTNLDHSPSEDDDSDWNYPNFYSDPKSVEVDLFHKISALESKVVELGESIWKRVRTNEEVYLANKSKIVDLYSSYEELDSRLKGTNYELVKVKKLLIEEEEDNG